MKKLICILFLLSLNVAVFAGNSDKEKAATKTISGKVTDAYGEALPGSKIIIKETGESVFADFNGNFKIALKADQVYSISVQTIGYQPKEIKSSELSMFSELSLQEL